jgi:hypothetical protein
LHVYGITFEWKEKKLRNRHQALARVKLTVKRAVDFRKATYSPAFSTASKLVFPN